MDTQRFRVYWTTAEGHVLYPDADVVGLDEARARVRQQNARLTATARWNGVRYLFQPLASAATRLNMGTASHPEPEQEEE